ncbi:unnamed protein product [Brassica oleracea var. botrytis]
MAKVTEVAELGHTYGLRCLDSDGRRSSTEQIFVCFFLKATSRAHFYYDQETQAGKNFLKVVGGSWSGSYSHMSSFPHL